MGTKFTHHLAFILPHHPSQLLPPSMVTINNAQIVLLPALAATTTKATVLPVAMVVTARPAAATMMTTPAMVARRLTPLPLTRLWERQVLLPPPPL